MAHVVWRINFLRKTIELTPEKTLKLKGQLHELKAGKVKQKLLEQVLGLVRSWLAPLYTDLHSPPGCMISAMRVCGRPFFQHWTPKQPSDIACFETLPEIMQPEALSGMRPTLESGGIMLVGPPRCCAFLGARSRTICVYGL